MFSISHLGIINKVKRIIVAARIFFFGKPEELEKKLINFWWDLFDVDLVWYLFLKEGYIGG